MRSFNPVSNNLESLVLIGNFNNSHGAQQKEKNFAYFAQMLDNLIMNNKMLHSFNCVGIRVCCKVFIPCSTDTTCENFKCTGNVNNPG
ncbi:hypothetical protein DSECCO2_539670 [anaerobic digester metagenome]